MKKIAFLVMILCLGVYVNAQKVFFIYLQAENRTPFYVRLSDKVFSSSSSGYLILSNLKDSVYTIAVGNAGAKNAEPRFTIPVEATDKGFLIKNFDDGPALFDLQTLVIHKPTISTVQSEQMISRTDSFTRKLAQAADDESLLAVPVVVKKETPKPEQTRKEPIIETAKAEPVPEEKKEVVNTTDTSAITLKGEEKPVEARSAELPKKPETSIQDTVVAKEPAAIQRDSLPETAPQENIPVEPFIRSVITRRSESSTTEGFGLVYLDTDQSGSTDTIRLLIPNPKKVALVEDKNTAVAVVEQSVSDVKTKDPVKETLATQPEKKGNSCDNVATEKDFLKLRKNMAAETNDEEMIAEAKKYFKTKCFTTEQIRYLSTLFLTGAAKYQFFDAAFKYVSDTILFPSLSAEIKDEYYSKRFKALIGE